MCEYIKGGRRGVKNRCMFRVFLGGVGHIQHEQITSRDQKRPDLAIDPVDLAILILELAAHVDGHVPQVADHRVDLSHVVLHLVFSRVVRYLAYVTARHNHAVVHHALGLVVDDLTVVVALPRALVLLEARAPKFLVIFFFSLFFGYGTLFFVFKYITHIQPYFFFIYYHPFGGLRALQLVVPH